MNFWEENAVEHVAIEAFIANAKSFKASYVIGKGKILKGVLSSLMDKVPAGSIWNEVREKLFAWRKQLKDLKAIAIKCDDKNVILGSCDDLVESSTTLIDKQKEEKSLIDDDDQLIPPVDSLYIDSKNKAEKVAPQNDANDWDDDSLGKLLVNQIGFGKTEIKDDIVPKVRCLKYSLPKNLNLWQVSFILKCLSAEPINFKGFKLDSQSDWLEYQSTSMNYPQEYSSQDPNPFWSYLQPTQNFPMFYSEACKLEMTNKQEEVEVKDTNEQTGIIKKDDFEAEIKSAGTDKHQNEEGKTA